MKAQERFPLTFRYVGRSVQETEAMTTTGLCKQSKSYSAWRRRRKQAQGQYSETDQWTNKAVGDGPDASKEFLLNYRKQNCICRHQRSKSLVEGSTPCSLRFQGGLAIVSGCWATDCRQGHQSCENLIRAFSVLIIFTDST